MSEQERRYKVIYVDQELMITAMTALTNDGGSWVCLPVFKGLPEGFSVRAVHYEFQRLAFGVVIFHESFPIVPAGNLYEVISMGLQMKTFDMDMIRQRAKEHPNG